MRICRSKAKAIPTSQLRASAEGQRGPVMALVQRFIAPGEIGAAMAFFRDYWGANHILGNDRDFLLWQMSPRRSPIFENAGIAAISYWDDTRLIGLIGVMSMAFNCNGDVAEGAWLCNLQAAPEYRDRGIGAKLMTSVHSLPISVVGAAGINLAVLPMYRAMRYHCHDGISRFIRVLDGRKAAGLMSGASELGGLMHPQDQQAPAGWRVAAAHDCGAEWDSFWSRFTRAGYFGTERDAAFMNWRYLQHPRLAYTLSLARNSLGAIGGAMVHRIETIRDREDCVLRVIELIAREAGAYEALIAEAERLGRESGAAFADHYTTQPRPDIFHSRGWYAEDDHPEVVTPGLFQPLLRQTRKINLAIRLIGGTPWKATPWRENLFAVKSDGDQDRPY